MKFLRVGLELLYQGKKDRIFSHGAFGVFTEKEVFTGCLSERVRFFDLSSLTKVLSTFFILLHMFEIGYLDPSAEVGDYLKEGNCALRRVRLRDLMNHTSGLPAWFPFYRFTNPNSPSPFLIKGILPHIIPSLPGGLRHYSDVGYMLLGLIIEKVSGKGINENFEYVKKMWGIDEVFFNGGQQDRMLFAPSGYSRWRRRNLRGEVHDDNAYALGGDAGHAGLFGSAEGISNFMMKFLNSLKGGKKYLDKKVFEKLYEEEGRRTFVSGWDYPSERNSTSGRYFSSFTIGHLGFTGTALWIDLERSFGVLLLTNRTIYGTGRKRINDFRRQFFTSVAKFLV